jgi:general secretion pathway protein K
VTEASASARNGGFALIIVLWTLVLIAFLVAQLAGTGHREILIAQNITSNAVAEAAADGAINRAIFLLLSSDPEHRWAFDGNRHDFEIGHCRVAVRLFDEAAKINPNLAAPDLLEKLLLVTGSAPDAARRIAAAIGAWVGADRAARSPAALIAEYRDAGRDYAPPSEPLESLGELRRVIGVTPAVFAAIRPHLSLFAPPVPDLAHADPVVRAAMQALSQRETDAPPRAAPSGPVTVRIEARAGGAPCARNVRAAVVRITPGSASYSVLAWGSDPAD